MTIDQVMEPVIKAKQGSLASSGVCGGRRHPPSPPCTSSPATPIDLYFSVTLKQMETVEFRNFRSVTVPPVDLLSVIKLKG